MALNQLSAQQVATPLKTIVKAYPLIQQMNKKLNGTINAALGGISRTLIPITLPAFTIEWNYSFSTSRDGSAAKNLQLASQLAILVSKAVPGAGIFTGLSESALSSIITPSGSIPVNVYLLDPNNANAFINNRQFNYYAQNSATNATQAAMTVRDLTTGTWYLAIENYSARSAVLVDIEAVAIQSMVVHPSSMKKHNDQ